MTTPNWIIALLKGANQRARVSGFECTLTPDDVVELWDEQDGKCFWFGVRMAPVEERYDLTLPSLDRVDSGRGYTRGNVVLACLAANLAKRDTSPDQWEDFLEMLKLAMQND